MNNNGFFEGGQNRANLYQAEGIRVDLDSSDEEEDDVENYPDIDIDIDYFPNRITNPAAGA